MSSHEQLRANEALTARDQGDVFRPTERFEQPREARPAGVVPSDARSIEKFLVTVRCQKRATRMACRARSRANCGVVALWFL
jgi:hypothetical protein